MTDTGGERTAAGVSRDEILAACALHALPGVGNAGLHAIARAFGSLRKAFEAGPRELFEGDRAPKLSAPARAYLERTPDLRALGEWALGAAEAAGARVLLLGDPAYPPLLASIENPPMLLYVRGTLAAEARRAAVVGARQADEAGLAMATRLGSDLARFGVEVVSGGARGIDAAAHAGSCEGGGPTIAVLGTGIDVPYPKENGDLFERIAAGRGAIVSELPPGTAPLPANFPRRNRTVAGLSHATIVVRAAMRSGAMITADHAVTQRRTLLAVPGDPGNPIAAGPGELLRLRAAEPCRGAEDVFISLGWPVPEELRGRSVASQGVRTVPGHPPSNDPILDEQGLRLWELLDERTASHLDELAVRAKLTASQALRKLAELEQKGMCLQRPGKFFLRRMNL
jgi:DNA processing protein